MQKVLRTEKRLHLALLSYVWQSNQTTNNKNVAGEACLCRADPGGTEQRRPCLHSDWTESVDPVSVNAALTVVQLQNTLYIHTPVQLGYRFDGTVDLKQ